MLHTAVSAPPNALSPELILKNPMSQQSLYRTPHKHKAQAAEPHIPALHVRRLHVIELYSTCMADSLPVSYVAGLQDTELCTEFFSDNACIRYLSERESDFRK